MMSAPGTSPLERVLKVDLMRRKAVEQLIQALLLYLIVQVAQG
jgi:hypothetical protein